MTTIPSYAIMNKRFALVAQSVERRLGKAEVGGSSPLGSLLENTVFTRIKDTFQCPFSFS